MHLSRLLNDFMKELQVDFALCGGEAIDLFLGKKTRSHKDLDVTVFWPDRNKIVEYMLSTGWDVYEPCGCTYLHKINNIADQKCIKTNIWCVKSNSHYQFKKHLRDMYAVSFDGAEQNELNFIEFLFNHQKEGCFLYAGNKEIKRNLDHSILTNQGIPYLAPELVLLYKSNATYNPDYQLDYDNAVPKMSTEQRTWLKKALSNMFPDGHIWLAKL